MQIPGESIGIIADDLTGACDTALQFHLEGGNARILLDMVEDGAAGSNQTWVANTDSRHMEQFDAIATVRKTVHAMRQRMGLDRFYKKMDSTLRGHVAQECLAVLDELRWKAAIIAPAYPDEDRRTVGGYQLVHGLPVGKTDTALDPLFPVRESHLPTFLGQTSDPAIVGHISLSKVMDGAGPILMALTELINQGKKLIVVDACSDTDLEQLSLAINKMPSDINVLPCGSAGLAKALSRKWVVHRTRPPKPPIQIEASPLLMVLGSNSGITRRQTEVLISHFADHATDSRLEIFQLTPQQILGLTPLTNEVDRIISSLKAQATVILTTSLMADSLTKTVIMAEEHNMAPQEASNRAAQLLGRITQDVLAQAPAKLLLSGGDTANSVCKALGVKTLQLVDQLETSIPLMIDDQARWIITKSGGFGSEYCLLNIFNQLQRLEAQAEAAEVENGNRPEATQRAS